MIKAIIKSVVKRPLKVVKRMRAASEVRRLFENRDHRLHAIGQATNDSIKGVADETEKAWIRRIEQRRKSLLVQQNCIEMIDYGAGSATSLRRQEEMRAGVRSTVTVARVAQASKPAFWAGFLFRLVRRLKPRSCFELGTCVGISAAYQGAALHLNGEGNLMTLEGSPEIARIAKETLDLLQVTNTTVTIGAFHMTLRRAIESVRPVDYFFNDGHHDHDAVLTYFDEALPHLAADAVVVIDDISWSPGMRQAWTEIAGHERVIAAVDFGVLGVACLGDALGSKSLYRIPL